MLVSLIGSFLYHVTGIRLFEDKSFVRPLQFLTGEINSIHRIKRVAALKVSADYKK